MRLSFFVCILTGMPLLPAAADQAPSATLSPDDTVPSPSLPDALDTARIQALAHLHAGRYEDARNLPAVLAAKFPGKAFVLFWPEEMLWIDLISRRWDLLLEPGRWNTEFSAYSGGTSAPRADPYRFEESLRGLFLARAPGFEAELDRQSLEPFKKEFLRLVFLHRIPLASREFHGTSGRIVRLTEGWLRKYPGNPYVREVREHIRNRLEPGLLGMGCDFGTSLNLPLAGLGRRLDRKPALGFGIEGLLGRASLRGQVMWDLFAGLDRDLQVRGDTWNRSQDFVITSGEVQAGIEAWRSGKWRAVPFASWGAVILTNVTKRDSLEPGKEGSASIAEACPGFGIHLQRSLADVWHTDAGYAGLAAGMRYPQLWRSLPGLAGGEVFLEFRIGYLSRDWFRVP
jgi:hypothetical protein